MFSFNSLSPVTLLFMAATGSLLILIVGILIGVSRNRPIIGGTERNYDSSSFATLGLLVAGGLFLIVLLSFSQYKLSDMLPAMEAGVQSESSIVEAKGETPQTTSTPEEKPYAEQITPPPLKEPKQKACCCLQLNAYAKGSKNAANYRDELQREGHRARALNHGGHTKVAICDFANEKAAKAYGRRHGLKDKIVFRYCDKPLKGSP